ncbi:hypothetical protein OK351_11475 [Glutamicibacter sp. MNS18]|nr:hypothetical protein [Glutamicibacter sp. MNS18]MCW4466118.1 hypothetical protein [Glutamicibacter sp. MNS18]
MAVPFLIVFFSLWTLGRVLGQQGRGNAVFASIQGNDVQTAA